MKKLLIILLYLPVIGISQNTDYELEFNSTTQDYVQMPNTSATIANKTAFSISCWVNPQANTTHSGIMGFRNNMDADFYLLQLQNTNTIEARFRNSSGLNYDITATNLLDFNQWQHLAFTYDGSYIRLYKDGIIIDSTYANGIITQSTQSFRLAALDYQTDVFNMNGRLDEVRLWDVALSQTEINNWMCIPIDATHLNYNNLMGYWRLNEGVGTTIIDLSINGNNGLFINNPFWDLSTTCFASTAQTITYIPDDNFETYLEANGMGNGVPNDDSVTTANINTVTYLDVSSQTISDLTGIEDFTALTFMDCKDNQISSLDLSNNLYLEFVACYNNQLNSLDVSGLADLWNLDCGNNNLTSLDLSNNTALQEFSIYNNQLISLDVSNNIMLGILAASGNQLTSIDVSNNIYLSELSLYGNSLFSLDVAYNTNLVDLNCDGNQITNIDLSNNTALTHLYCSGNQLISLNISQNLSLTHLSCGANPLTALDLSNNTSLINLDCFNNQLTTLDLSNNPALIYLICKKGQLTSLDLRNGNNQLIGTMHCKNNPNLYCINVDDVSWSTVNWTFLNYSIDSQHYFSNNCPAQSWDCNNGVCNDPGTGSGQYSTQAACNAVCVVSAIQEHTTNKELLKVIDLLGRETKGTMNEVLFYIYDDGTVEKRIVIE